MTGASRPNRLPARFLTLFLLVYAVQGVVFAYFINFNPTYMSAGGVDEQTVATVQTIALLPFILKFLAGPLSDRFPLLGLGHRRPYILLGLILQVLGLVGLASFTSLDGNVPLFAAVAVITVTGLALYDTCTDGWIIDLTPPPDRARVQGLVMGSRFLCATLFSLLFGIWLQRTGTGPGRGYAVLWACAALTLIPLVMAAFLSEPSRHLPDGAFDWRALGVLVRPRSLAVLAFGAFYAVVSYGVEINLPLFYHRLDYGEAAIGGFGASRNLGRAAGALLLPLGMLQLGRRWTMRIAVLSLAISQASQALGTSDAGPFVGALGFCFGAANGWTDALFYVLAMEASDPRLAASTYALFMAVSNLSVTGGKLFSMLIAVLGGSYSRAFVVAALITLPALAMIWPLSKPPRHEPVPEPPHA
jgi:MFS transporter, PAT family, beta-lactamase induction signal transducer AmpG